VILVPLSCVECKAQSETAETLSPVILPAATPVILRLTKSLYKKDAKPGQPVEFEVGYDVLVNGQVFIQSGAPVTGSVRQVDHAAKGPPKVLIDLGPVQTVSGETVRLRWTRTATASEQPGLADAVSWGGEAWPILPVFVVMSLFEKRALLDKDAWGGGWRVVQSTEDVTLDPAKQKAAQERYNTNRKVAQAELCELFASPLSSNGKRIGSLARQSGLGDLNKAALLRTAGDLDGAIEEYHQLLTSKQDLPCLDKYPELSGGAAVYLHLELAELYGGKRDFVHAISECRIAVQLSRTREQSPRDPENELARIGLISTLQDSGDLDAAIAESKEAIGIWPNKPYFHYLLGRVLVKKNDPDAAIVELRLALKEHQNHLSPANCELGRAWELKGDRTAALREYRTAFRAHVNDEQCRAAYERLQLQPKK